MNFGLDTSVAIRLLVGEPADQADAARDVVNQSAPGAIVVSDVVVGETYFALRHHYRVPHAKAIAAIRALLSDRRLHSDGVAKRLIDSLSDREVSPGFMDRLIHAGYDHDGAVLLTFDRDAAKLPNAKLLSA